MTRINVKNVRILIFKIQRKGDVASRRLAFLPCSNWGLVLQVDEGDEGGLAGLDDEEEDGGEDEGLHGEGKPAVGALEAELPGVGREMEEESHGDGHDDKGISGYELRGYLGVEVGEDGCGHVADMADRLGTEEGEADGDEDEGDEDVGGADDGAGHYILF